MKAHRHEAGEGDETPKPAPHSSHTLQTTMATFIQDPALGP